MKVVVVAKCCVAMAAVVPEPSLGLSLTPHPHIKTPYTLEEGGKYSGRIYVFREMQI